MTDRLTILEGDCIEQLKTLPDESVHCVVTSPPYWGLRDYGVSGQIGLEPTPELYVAKMVSVFREVKRVLRKDGSVWCNLGDSYATGGRGGGMEGEDGEKQRSNEGALLGPKKAPPGLKPKDLCGIPWRVAFALQADGWWLRQDIIWAKPNPMPESVTDRCTKAHEYVFLLTKSASYFYDAEAVKEPSVDPIGSAARYGYDFSGRPEGSVVCPGDKDGQRYAPKGSREFSPTRNRRSVWTIPSQAYSEAHFATFPEALVKPCVLAGTSARGCCPKCGAPWVRVVDREFTATSAIRNNGTKGMDGSNSWGEFPRGNTESKTTGWQPTCQHGEDPSEVRSPIPCTVLDPFGGSGTTGQVALELGRNAILIELNPAYAALIRDRCAITPGLNLA